MIAPIDLKGINDTPHFVLAPYDPIAPTQGGVYMHLPIRRIGPIEGPVHNGTPPTGLLGSGGSSGSTSGGTSRSVPRGVLNPTPIPSTPPATTGGGSTPGAPSSAPGENQSLLDTLNALLAGEGTSASGGYNASTDPASLALQALTPQATPTSSTGNAAAIVVVIAIAAAVGAWFYFRHKKGAQHADK